MSADPRIEEFEAALIAVDRAGARRIFMRGVDTDGAIPFMEQMVGPVLERIGRAWEQERLSLSQVYMAGKICEELSLSVLPASHPDRTNNPRVAVAVFEDHHMLGKQMVHAILRNDGYLVQDWGKLNLQGAMDKVRLGSVDVLLLSSLMLSSALRIEKLCGAIKNKNLPVKVLVGGAPFRFDEGLWREIGADAMGSNASQAPGLVRGLTGGRP